MVCSLVPRADVIANKGQNDPHSPTLTLLTSIAEPETFYGIIINII